MKTIKFLLAATCASALLLTGCKEEMRLYTMDSEEPIPHPDEVRTQMQQQQRPRSPHPPMGGPAGMPGTAGLPAPINATFEAPELSELLKTVTVKSIEFQVPARWMVSDSASQFRAMEITVPGEGAEEGELIVYHFGVGQGGSAADNVARWRSQFVLEGPEPLQRHEAGTSGPLALTRTVLEGTWAPSAMGPGAPKPDPRDGWMLDGLIIEGGAEGALYLRLTGPKDLIVREEPSMAMLAATAKPVEGTIAPGAVAPGAAARDPHAGHNHAPGDLSSHGVTEQVIRGTDGYQTLETVGVKFELPIDWTRGTPSNKMRVLQYAIPNPSGDAGEVVAFHFGPGGGGSADANIQRWIGQVTTPTGASVSDTAKTWKKEVNGLTISFVEVDGTYNAGTMGMGGGPKADQTLVGLVVEGWPEGPLFIRITGPSTLLDQYTEATDHIIASFEKL